MDAAFPFSYIGSKLHQVAFVVKDIAAARKFFNEKLGVPRFYVMDDFSDRVKDKTYRGKPADHKFKIAITYSGETQLELCQHVAGDTCYRDFLERRGEGLHHLAYFLEDAAEYDRALADLARGGLSVIMSGRVGALRFAYFDTEAATGSITELVYVPPASQEFFAKIKRGDF